MDAELVLYGLEVDATERWQEVLLGTSDSGMARLEAIRALAARDGFHSFRVAKVHLGAVPNFAACLSRS